MPDGSVLSLVHVASAREALSAPANIFEILRRPPERDRRLGHRPLSPRDAQALRPGARGSRWCAPTRCASRSSSSGAWAARAPCGKILRLDAGARRLEFHTEVDWRESHRLLKVAFPVDVRAMNATYEMQFGVVERPTHFNTSYDLAKFEVPGHRFADLSEHGFGVSLLSNCKYGLQHPRGSAAPQPAPRTPLPDPNADRGEHRFAYALYPHTGGYQEGGVIAEARRFGVPVIWGGTAAEPSSLFWVDDPNLVLDNVKRAEEGHSLILRLYEAHGARGRARLYSALPFSRASMCDLLEREVSPIAYEQAKVGSIELLIGRSRSSRSSWIDAR